MKQLKEALLVVLLSLSLVACVPLDEGAQKEANGELEIEYIDVAQGDSSLLISPNGKVMLIDAGKPKAYPEVKEALDDRHIKKVDTLIVTHPHEDHIGGIPKVMENYEIGRLYMNGKAKSEAYKKVRTLAKKKHLEITPLLSGSQVDWDKSVDIKVFSPYKEGVLEGLNNESPIMKVSYNKHGFLFTGDAEREAEDTALAYDSKGLKSEVVKVGHHGSHTSSIPDFVLATKPKLAIISVGAGNSYGHPHKNIVKRWQTIGAEVYSTEKSGNIIIKTKGKELWLMTEKTNQALAS